MSTFLWADLTNHQAMLTPLMQSPLLTPIYFPLLDWSKSHIVLFCTYFRIFKGIFNNNNNKKKTVILQDYQKSVFTLPTLINKILNNLIIVIWSKQSPRSIIGWHVVYIHFNLQVLLLSSDFSCNLMKKLFLTL